MAVSPHDNASQKYTTIGHRDQLYWNPISREKHFELMFALGAELRRTAVEKANAPAPPVTSEMSQLHARMAELGVPITETCGAMVAPNSVAPPLVQVLELGCGRAAFIAQLAATLAAGGGGIESATAASATPVVAKKGGVIDMLAVDASSNALGTASAFAVQQQARLQRQQKRMKGAAFNGATAAAAAVTDAGAVRARLRLCLDVADAANYLKPTVAAAAVTAANKAAAAAAAAATAETATTDAAALKLPIFWFPGSDAADTKEEDEKLNKAIEAEGKKSDDDGGDEASWDCVVAMGASACLQSFVKQKNAEAKGEGGGEANGTTAAAAAGTFDDVSALAAFGARYLVYGEAYWNDAAEVSDAYLRGFECATKEEFGMATRSELLQRFDAEGYDVSWECEASIEDWDTYEGAHLTNIQAYADSDEGKADTDSDALVKRAFHMQRLQTELGGREAMGYGMWLLVRRS
jgi:hypothetical protein